MSTYVSTSSFSGYANPFSSGGTISGSTETKSISRGLVSGVCTCVYALALCVFANIGPSTTTGNARIAPAKTASISVTNRDVASKYSANDSLVHVSNSLQHFFGFNTAQWAKLLKVERKTIYNWKDAPETKIKTSAADRIAVLERFSNEFDPRHADFFSKFLFGRHAEKSLLEAFLREPLKLDELLAQYDEIYVKLDGLVKRKALLG